MKSKMVTSWAFGALLLAAGCSEMTEPGNSDPVPVEIPTPRFAVELTCTVDVRTGGNLQCDPSASAGVAGAAMNVIVGGQHQYVRMANSPPVMDGTTWTADVTVQNLLLRPMGNDGNEAKAEGIRVFFVREPTNGVTIANADGHSTFTGSAPQPFYEYSGLKLGKSEYLSPGERSAPREWRFNLNGAVTFRFAVLISTAVPLPTAADSLYFERVSVGYNFNCGDDWRGNVYCWGVNGSGQLGDGTNTQRSTPQPVIAPDVGGLSGAAVGEEHACAEGAAGNVYCWGANDYGQLGIGNTSGSSVPARVVTPAGGVTLSRIAAGGGHTCAQGSDARIYCWGLNHYGQLGVVAITQSTVPVAVSEVSGGVTLSGVSAGMLHTCANGSDNKVYCWGDNWVGQLGNGTTTGSHSPVAVSAPDGVFLSDVSAGDEHTCAQGSDGRLYCWGANHVGELGNNTTARSSTPVAVTSPEGVSLFNVAAGHVMTCAAGSDGRFYCWGHGYGGRLGDNTTADRRVPTLVHAPADVTLTRGYGRGEHTCAVSSAGAAYCWGENQFNQLGNGTSTSSRVPVRVRRSGW